MVEMTVLQASPSLLTITVPSGYVSHLKALATSKHYFMVITANISVNSMHRQLKMEVQQLQGDVEESTYVTSFPVLGLPCKNTYCGFVQNFQGVRLRNAMF